jgi:C1A family cysteine protease
MPRQIAHYGWIPDLPDHRDYLYAAPVQSLAALPSSIDLRSSCPPVYDQGQLGSCFPAGTRIRMADGSHKPIEQVALLDQVVTAEGSIGIVTHTMVRGETEGIVALKLWGNNLLRLTGEHPVLTQRGYVKADELSLDDFVALPRYMQQSQQELHTSDYLESRERIVATGKRHYYGVQGRTAVQVEVKTMPEVIPLSGAFGRIIGLFLAEGTTDYGKVVWTFGQDETNTLVSELMMLLREELGLDPKLQIRGNKAVKVVVHGVAWAKLFERLCSSGAAHKRLAPVLMSGPREFQEAMLQGWLDGDGWHSVRGVSGVSISQDLALSMFDIANSLGLRPSINWGKAVQTKHVKMRQPRITVEIASKDDNWRVQQNATHMWRKVRSIEREPFAGYVYNLSVSGDNSYIAEGIGVHNCTANAIAAALEFDQMKQQLSQIFIPSRLFIYYNERVIEGTVDSDSGAMIRDGLKSVGNQGACPEDMWPYDITKFQDQPTQECYQVALQHRAIVYQRVVRDLNQMKGCLASGYPFVFGFTVYESFESQQVAQDGHVPMPQPNEQELGGHAVLAVGYDDTNQWFIVRNSWGENWGMKGYFTLPYAYLTSQGLSSDFWTIRTVQ